VNFVQLAVPLKNVEVGCDVAHLWLRGASVYPLRSYLLCQEAA
jgi:hypothetical protein